MDATDTTRRGRSASSSGSPRLPTPPLRNSPTNFTYAHIGHFADAGQAIANGDFAFANAVTLWGTQNRPRFFEGTAVAREAALHAAPVRAAAE